MPGALEGEQSIGKIFGDVLGEKYIVDQFFEPHAMVETLFMVQALEDIEKLGTLLSPQPWKDMPFALGVLDGKQIRWTSIIDRISTLSKGRFSELHAQRYLRLAPLFYYYGRWEDPLKLLVSAYGSSEFISIALEQGWSLTRLHSSRDIAQITADYSTKAIAYLEHFTRHTVGKAPVLRAEASAPVDKLFDAAL